MALGIAPTKQRILILLIGLGIAAVCCTLYYLSFTTLTTNKWITNIEYPTQQLAGSAWWIFKSVLYEELIFRGALLYILISKIGAHKACLISAVSFGIYHWFTSGALGHPQQMAIIFFMTGIWGWMFAIAFAKTKSLYLPIGLHFGWNFTSTVIFSQGPLGKQLLILSGEDKLGIALSIVVFIFQVFAVPLLTYGYLHWLSKKQKASDEASITSETISVAQQSH